jgi:hypothetical protein
MATTFQLTDGTVTVNLSTDADLKMSRNYLPAYTSPIGDGTIPGDITESIPVYIYVTTDIDDLADALQDVALLGRYAAEYMAGSHQTPVWLQRKANDETNAMQTLVKSVQFTPDARFGSPYDHPPAACAGRTGVLTVTHHPYNERTSAVAASGTDDVDVLGGAANYTDVVGDVPARLYYLHVDDLAVARIYRQFWMGFRSDARAGGDAANVASVWECEDGTANIDTALGPDATASPGGGGNTLMTCDFSPTTTWAERVAILMSDVTINYANQVGSYVVLLRAQVDAGVAQVYLRSGNGTNIAYRQGPVVDVADTAWTLYNLGVVEFPTRSLHAVPTALLAATYDQRDQLALWARVKPGEAVPSQFDMDCLVLIPCDEYFIHVQSAEVAATDDELYVCVAPEDVPEALTIDGTSNWIQNANPISTIGAGVPVGDGRLFICVANDNDGTAPAFDDDVDVEISTFPRWVHFRGDE